MRHRFSSHFFDTPYSITVLQMENMFLIGTPRPSAMNEVALARVSACRQATQAGAEAAESDASDSE
jgi:hypothetical protein